MWWRTVRLEVKRSLKQDGRPGLHIIWNSLDLAVNWMIVYMLLGTPIIRVKMSYFESVVSGYRENAHEETYRGLPIIPWVPIACRSVGLSRMKVSKVSATLRIFT